MIGNNHNYSAILYISFPEMQGMFDSKQLFLLNRIIELCTFEFPFIKGDQVE